MTATTTKPDIRFIVDVRPSLYQDNSRRLEAVAYPVTLEGRAIRNFSSMGQGSEYADLRIEGWIDMTTAEKNDFIFTDYRIFEYREIYSLDLMRLEKMTKLLRSLQKKIESLRTKYGYPQDFAAMLSYVAQAVGANPRNAFARKVSGQGWSYDDSEYKWMGVDDLRYYLQDELKKWRGDDAS